MLFCLPGAREARQNSALPSFAESLSKVAVAELATGQLPGFLRQPYTCSSGDKASKICKICQIFSLRNARCGLRSETVPLPVFTGIQARCRTIMVQTGDIGPVGLLTGPARVRIVSGVFADNVPAANTHAAGHAEAGFDWMLIALRFKSPVHNASLPSRTTVLPSIVTVAFTIGKLNPLPPS
jgi:hypothetical protein